MRSNSASEPWISTWMLSSWPSGKNKRLWRVVNATMTPADGAFGEPLAANVPASQYTNAGMIENTVPITMKNQRPTIACRICSLDSRRFRPRNFSIALACCPNVFESRIPETESVSSVIALISASDSCVEAESRFRTRPTR
jgi:hypothetical protein